MMELGMKQKIVLTTVYLIQVRQLRERMRVSERYVEYSMVCKSGHHGDGCGFLSSSMAGSGDEEASVFPSELSSGP